MNKILRTLFTFGRDVRGAVLPELAMALPMLILITLGGIEVARYALLHQKLDRVAASVGDLVAQAQTLTVADVNNLFDAVDHVAKPFELAADGLVVVSSVSKDTSTPPAMNWQQTGGGTLIASSQIGTPGGAVTLPAGFVMPDGDTVIIAEVFYDYTPWIVGGVTGPAQLYHRAIFRPRLGTLQAISP